MKSYALFLGAAVGLSVLAGAQAQLVPARLSEPHDDAVTPMFLSEYNLNGFAVVEAEVETDGKLGYGFPIALSHPDLVKYAVDGAKTFRYVPATWNGKAVPGWVDVPVFFPGDLNASDDQLWPLVHACAYVYHSWLKVRGYPDRKSQLEAHKSGFAGVRLIRKPQSEHIMADREHTDPRVKAAADLVDQWIGQANFPDKSLTVLQRVGGLTVLLPLAQPKTSQQP